MKKTAVLCPLREKSGKLEVFLTKRSFWNPKSNQLMTFPGEWVFAGGNYEPNDKNLNSTAIREFREEVGYKGMVTNISFIRSGNSPTYHTEFYAAQIDPEDFQPQTSEVTAVKWMTPDEWLYKIHSDQFNNQQLRELRKYGFQSRQMPLQTIATLEYLKSHHRRELK